MFLFLTLGVHAHAADLAKEIRKAQKNGVQWQVPDGAPTRPALEVDDVKITFNGSPPTRFTSKTAPEVEESLPDGFRVRMGPKLKLSERYVVVPDYPTADDPHLLLVGMVAPEKSEATLHGFRAVAAQHGADTIVLDRNMKSALAFHYSDAAPEAHPSADDALAERIATTKLESRGYTLDGEPQVFDLAEPVEWTVEADANSCYGIVLALESDAVLTDKALRILPVTSQNLSRTYSNGGGSWTSKKYDRRSPMERTHYAATSCTETAATIEVDFGKVALGTGSVKVQMVKRAASASESRDAFEDPMDDCFDCWFSGIVMCDADVDSFWDCPDVKSCVEEAGLKIDQCR